MRLKQTIRRILREEFNILTKVKRRLGEVEWNVHDATDRINKQFGGPCRFNEEEYVETIIEYTIESLYWDYFSYMDDNSKEWGDSYRFLVEFIEDNFGKKLREYYHINCGD